MEHIFFYIFMIFLMHEVHQTHSTDLEAINAGLLAIGAKW